MQKDQTNFVMNCLSEADGKLLNRILGVFVCVFICSCLLVYIGINSFSFETLENVMKSEILKVAIASYPLDHGYFLASNNFLSANRVWITEFAILLLSLISWFFSGVVTLYFYLKGKIQMTLLREEHVISRSVVSLFVSIAFVIYLTLIGFSEELILGQYRVSFGPNAFAILWFTSQMLILNLMSWGIYFYCLLLLAKLNLLPISK